MRIYKKKELLAMVSTLAEANSIIVKFIKSNPDAAMETLISCQESAILMGNYIDSLDSRYAYLVKLLEDYCENIFRMSEAVTDDIQCRKIAKKIQKQLNQFQHGVTCDLPDDRKEVVFLPYKASMWDSLESVWKAADEDPDCDAYVIPIPYYDKNPDGSFREMHYEGDQYPDYVPVTRYDEYDFEGRRPDAIFIHNPYDHCNFVTSVHPYFFSKNLKKFTDNLVYIPYFILDEIEPDDKAEIEGMEHFCTAPGVLNADKVIVQSENMRQIYINVLTETMSRYGFSRENWEKKILGLGSPKVDKVLNTKREDLEIPEEWMRIIRKPDGSWKKIVFYNTSISALLQHNEQMLVKMRDVFRVFKENRDEVALLWRPHPLIKATIGSMRPKLWQEYQEVVRLYQEDNWGIYDDTADMNRAVALSDAYYGDMSSVVQLYRMTGKPVILQNVEMEFELKLDRTTGKIKRKYIPEMGYLFRDGDKLYTSVTNYNAIMSIDLKSGKVSLEGNFPDEKREGGFLFGQIKKYQSYLIMAPFRARHIQVFDLKTKSNVSLKEKYDNRQLNALGTSRSVFTDNQMYFLPSDGKMLLRLDLQNMAVEKIENFIDEYQQKLGKAYTIFSKSGAHEYQGKLYVALYEEGYIMEFSCDTMQITYYKVEEAQQGFMQLIGISDRLYLLGRNRRIVQWNITDKITEAVHEVHIESDKSIECMQNSLCSGENIYYFASRDVWGIRYNLSTDQIIVNTYEKMWNLEVESGEKYRYASYDEEGNVYFVSNRNHVYIADINGKHLRKLTMQIPYDDLDALFAGEESRKHVLPFGGTNGFQISQLL